MFRGDCRTEPFLTYWSSLVVPNAHKEVHIETN
jgi:hypothetical protein